MASVGIAMALLLVVALKIPFGTWAARAAASVARRGRGRRCNAIVAAHGLVPGLRRLATEGARVCEQIDHLGPIAADYRRTLPYLNLFFADGRTGLDSKGARRVVLARQDYELAVSDLARQLVRWTNALRRLSERDRIVLEETGGAPDSVAALLDDGSRLPRDPIEAQRLRFCEAWEVERLQESLEGVADDLTRLQQALLDVRVGPYR